MVVSRSPGCPGPFAGQIYGRLVADRHAGDQRSHDKTKACPDPISVGRREVAPRGQQGVVRVCLTPLGELGVAGGGRDVAEGGWLAVAGRVARRVRVVGGIRRGRLVHAVPAVRLGGRGAVRGRIAWRGEERLEGALAGVGIQQRLVRALVEAGPLDVFEPGVLGRLYGLALFDRLSQSTAFCWSVERDAELVVMACLAA